MTDTIRNIGVITNYQKFPAIGVHLTEPASSPAAWHFYQRVYTRMGRNQQETKLAMIDGFTLETPTMQLNSRQFLRYVAAPRRDGADTSAPSLKVGGLPVFNFDDAVVRELFVRGDFQRTNDMFVEQLFFCHGMFNSPLNMTLFPEFAGLNGLVAGLDVDDNRNIVFDSNLSRFDTFLQLLYQYYQGKSDVLLQKAGDGRQSLSDFLNLFMDDQGAYASVKNFCHDVCLVDLPDVHLRWFLIMGGLPIADDDDVMEYCTNAETFWRVRAETLDRILA